MTKSIVGIDVSKLSLDIALLHEQHTKYLVVENNPNGFQNLCAWLEDNSCGQVHLCMEATGKYGFAAAEYLYAQGFRVSMINPASIKAYAASRLKRNKTDKSDALLIAEFCLKENPPLWCPSRPASKALKALVRHRNALMSTKRQYLNRQEFLSDAPLVDSLQDEFIALVNVQIERLRKAIHQLIMQDPIFKRHFELLVSIPGIAEITASRLLAEIPDFLAFSNSRQLTAYAGLNPRQFQSGSSVHRKCRLSKTGNAALRGALYMPALVAMRKNDIICEFSQRLLDRGLPKMVVVGAAMRKLLVISYGVIKSDSPFDPLFAQNRMVSS